MTPKESFALAVAINADHWVPANGGTETPFVSRSGLRLLWCYNPREKRHAFLDLSCDIILSDEEAMHALGVARALNV